MLEQLYNLGHYLIVRGNKTPLCGDEQCIMSSNLRVSLDYNELFLPPVCIKKTPIHYSTGRIMPKGSMFDGDSTDGSTEL